MGKENPTTQPQDIEQEMLEVTDQDFILGCMQAIEFCQDQIQSADEITSRYTRIIQDITALLIQADTCESMGIKVGYFIDQETGFPAITMKSTKNKIGF